ncbi:Uncharacterized protein Fot_20011 [Forsythia ovata]|uniref:Uncharacterized protein n=1 Tax=Forsythia ovata TaxID=205694 RepID=A0ABD1VMN7_9LAMI
MAVTRSSSMKHFTAKQAPKMHHKDDEIHHQNRQNIRKDVGMMEANLQQNQRRNKHWYMNGGIDKTGRSRIEKLEVAAGKAEGVAANRGATAAQQHFITIQQQHFITIQQKYPTPNTCLDEESQTHSEVFRLFMVKNEDSGNEANGNSTDH